MSPTLIHDDHDETPGWTPPAIRSANIPDELKALDQWVCWRPIRRGEKVTKVPFRADLPEAEASTIEPRSWASFATAHAACHEPDHRFGGLGFVFTATDPYAGWDLDNCLTSGGTAIEVWAREILDQVPGYAEVSPSGRGLKVWTLGECPEGKGRKRGGFLPIGGAVECYDRGRYFTVTGRVFEGRKAIVAPGRPFADVHGAIFEPRKARPRVAPAAPREGDAEIVDRAMKARNSAKFAGLWDGQLNGYPSKSEADLALCSLLSFFTQDPATIERIFGQSGLVDTKWTDRPDYRELTIEKALNRSTIHDASYNSTNIPQNNSKNPNNCINSPEDDGESEGGENKCNSRYKNNSSGEIPARARETGTEEEEEPHPHFGGDGDSSSPWSTPRLDGPEPSPPFPLEALPVPLQGLLVAVAESMACPVDFPALAALGIASGAIGRSVALVVKDGWIECPSLYGAVVGHPGMTKSPPLALLARPLWDLTHDQLKAHKRELDLHRQHAKKDDPEPAPPRRVIVDEITVEALAGLLGDNARGLVMVKDELSGLFGGMNQYKAGGKGNDRQFYLSAWSGSSVAVDRKHAPDKRPVTVSHPFLSIVGGLTPDMLSELGEGKGRDDGFLDRVVFAAPDRVKVRWTDRGVPPELELEWAEALKRLWAEPMTVDLEGRPRPWFVRFTPEAAAAFACWYDAHEEEAEGEDFPAYLRGPWSKFRGYAARLALLIDRLGRAFEPDGLRGAPADVDADALSRAMVLTSYFKAQTRRVRAMMRGSFGECPDARKLLTWLRRKSLPRFKASDARHNFRKTFPVDGPELDRALTWLTSRHCIRPVLAPRDRPGPGRPASIEYQVNPALLGDMGADD